MKEDKHFSQKDVISSEYREFENEKGVVPEIDYIYHRIESDSCKDCDKDKCKHPLLMEWVVCEVEFYNPVLLYMVRESLPIGKLSIRRVKICNFRRIGRKTEE